MKRAVSFGLLLAGVGGLLAGEASEAWAAQKGEPLRLRNVNTGEEFDIPLFIGTSWNKNALLVCDWLMRDHREGIHRPCDPKLYAALYVLQRYYANGNRVHIHSGFRTSTTNEMLRRRQSGVARNSLHMHAKAVDFSIPGADLRSVARTARQLNIGGVGLYKGHIHIDTGEKRTWGLPL